MKLFTVLMLLASPVLAQEVLKDYKPLTNIILCQDVQLPCAMMIPKDVDIFFAVFSKKGELIAITRMHDGKEETVWGKLPLKVGEKEL